MNQIKKSLALLLLLLFSASQFSMVAAATQMEDTYAVLQAQEVYLVSYSEDHSPFSYTNENGDAAGMAIDMMNYIASIAGITVEYVSLEDTANYDADGVDINLSILKLDQLESNSTKSEPYFQFQLTIMSHEADVDFEGASVGHLGYSAFTNEMIEEGLEGCTSITYYSYEDLQAAFASDDLDYILATSLVAQETSALDVVSIPTELTLDAMLKFNDAMSQEQIDAFNALILSLDTQNTYTIMLNAALLISTSSKVTVVSFVQSYIYQIIIAIAVIILIIISVILVVMNNKRKTLEHMLNVDELTGLMSERKFKAVMHERLATAKQGETFYVISFDIDNFKYINEIHGYQKGTQTIQAFGSTLQQVFSEAIGIARPFADNFLIFTQVKPINGNICGKEECVHCMDHCLNGILGQDYRLITSAGIYQVVDYTLSTSYMIDCANIARRRGKGTYNRTEWVFTKALENEIKVKNDIISSMEKGIRDREFRVYYQPKIDFQTEKMVGAEALVRWFREDGTQFCPNDFISLFERNGFIARLDYYVMNDVAAFLAKHPELTKVSVNVSGKTFLEKDLIDRIVQIIEKNGISADRIEIEVTESAIVNEFELIRQRIDDLKEIGFTVSMDDFGAGLSSLNRLKDISIDVLKIDKEFLGLDTLSKKGESIIASIIDMTKKIEVETVAEGVETANQVNLLRTLSCDTAQGFYYARPMPEEEFLAFASEKQ